ncbi:hypothetical protein SUNI508_03090 [Seiridium unicorne]|uniref:Acetylserotonin methytransferase-like protein n=1 Tax=Seiridium unicorne TaxID=138068 RepID=A0ABR2VGX6_9PEZI
MSPVAGPSGGSFSLFPSTNPAKPPSRKTTPRPRAASPQYSEQERDYSFEMTPPRNGRRTPEDLSHFVIDGTPTQHTAQPQEYNVEQAVAQPVAPADAPTRTDTAFSGATTLVRGNSTRSRSSIAKRPFEDESSPREETAGFRSIFPRYDHSLPFDRQDYFPTQTSPSHIPRQVISRQSHVPQNSESRSPPVRSPVRSPMSADSTRRWPPRQQEPPIIPPVSTTDDLRDYWKAANGWKASPSEGRTYCMKLEPEKDTPIYYLSSDSQPFYHMRIVPTSASAYITLSRHDPTKPFKERNPTADARPQGILAALREPEKSKTWHEAINTTLEEESRRLPPEDGLVALLYPCAATKMALDKPGDIQAVMTAERECARLVWDEDSQNYFMVHPALATPFCITVERNQAWSRTEYTLEHIESPQHLAKLTRDGTGEGWMELDTLIAGRIEAHYILDVAVSALLIVANLDEKNHHVETFEPPPMLPPPAHLRESGRESRNSLASKLTGGKDSKKKRKRRNKLEEIEMDLESQTSSLGKQLEVKDKDKLPGTTRTVIKLITFAFKCFVWALTLLFKALVALVAGLSKCLTSEKL